MSRKRNELVIKPASGLINGNGFVAEVTYEGVPKPLKNETLGEGGFLHTADGAIALGQPESASTWYPVNDHPSDKAAYDFEVTVPDGLTAVSNGVPGGKASKDGWTTWKWSEKSPMASYLSTLVIGKFRITTGEHKGRPVYNAVATNEAKGAADASIAQTVKVADYLESVFGPYPFDAYGGVVISDSRISYALETQSRPVYSAELLPAGREHRGGRPRAGAPVVRRQRRAGQVGGHLAQRGLRDVRGVALGRAHQAYTAKEAFDNRYARMSAQVWKTPPGKPGVEKLFSESVYQRGGMTLHALRVAVGDKAFFEIVKTWAAEKRDGTATTAEFVALAERISGKQLDALFDAWLYGTKKPALPKRL